MSFDDDPDDYDDGWYEPDEDEPDDDNWHWYDDPPRPPKEEPDCYVCNDDGGRCCEPTRLDVFRSRAGSWLQSLWDKLSWRRQQVRVDDPWAPAAPATPPASSGSFIDEPPF